MTLLEKTILELFSLVQQFSWFNKEKLDFAIQFSQKKHSGQFRKISNEPYFIHPLRVAIALANELDADLELITGGLLHDVVEDTATSIDDIGKIFGPIVKNLVEGMTKPPKSMKKEIGIEKYYEMYYDNLKKSVKNDSRVLKIKLSDRIDNLSDYKLFASKEKIERYTKETKLFLNFAKDFGIESPLIPQLQQKLIGFMK